MITFKTGKHPHSGVMSKKRYKAIKKAAKKRVIIKRYKEVIK